MQDGVNNHMKVLPCAGSIIAWSCLSLFLHCTKLTSPPKVLPIISVANLAMITTLRQCFLVPSIKKLTDIGQKL